MLSIQGRIWNATFGKAWTVLVNVIYRMGRNDLFPVFDSLWAYMGQVYTKSVYPKM